MKKIVVLVLTLLFAIGLVACGNTASINDDDSQDAGQVKEATSFELIAGEAGEYGELFTLNKDTECEETYYMYRIPAGTYTVTNSGKYMNQFNVYGDTVQVNDAGWEELSDVIYVKLLDVGETDTFTIEDGQIVEIHEPAQFSLEKCE